FKGILEHPGAVVSVKYSPEFVVQSPTDGRPASVGNGSPVGFCADSKAQVDSIHAAALAAGAGDEGAPGPRPLYGEPYYGCFIRDLDGHKVEASYWDMSQGFDAHDHAH
ncbi:VOC family protein, partial [Pseudomonas aeruginosa]